MEPKPYKTIFLVLVLGLIVWFSGSSEKKIVSENPGDHYNPKPALLADFVPPQLLILDDSENTLPRRNWSVPALEVQAEAALAMRPDGGRIYYNKNMETKRPVASLTKLMTAIIVLENYQPDEIITVPVEAVKREGNQGDLRPSEKLTVRSLLSIMLIDSSNDAAFTLASQKENFISLMNQKARDLGLRNTHFTNPDGLDEEDNYSSAFDIAKIFVYLFGAHPEALDVFKTQNMVVYSADGEITHRLQNTNELLGRMNEIIGGKTGHTDKAGGSLVLLTKNNIITVVLGSPDRFGESEKLIKWLRAAYIWEK
jgi:D-alanyl-D-alanine carboxypeptidase